MGLKRSIKRCVKDYNKKRMLTRRSYTAIKTKLATPAVIGGTFLGGIAAGFLIPKHKDVSEEKQPTTTGTSRSHTTPKFSNYFKRQLYEGLSMILVMPGLKTIMDKIRLF